MGFAAALSAGAQIIGGLSGLFSSKKGAPSARENTVKLAQGARQAAERYGFNPLTMLQYGGGAVGGGGGGAPPLASVEMLTSGLRDFDDITSGDAQRRRAAEQLELDLARLKLEQARSGVAVAPVAAVNAVGAGPSPLGRRAVTVMQGGAVSDASRAVTRSGVAKPDNPNASHPLRFSLGNVSAPDQTLDRGAGYYVGGARVEGAPGWSSGESIEQEYGDSPVSWGYSVAKLGADIVHNIGRAFTESEAEALKKQGKRVVKINGKYYAQDPDKPKTNPNNNYYTARHGGPMIKFH